MTKRNIIENEYAIIKVLATVLIVVQHVIVFYSYNGGVIPMPSNSVLHYISKFIMTFVMPLFVFVSGAVYQYGKSCGKYKRFILFLKKKFN